MKGHLRKRAPAGATQHKTAGPYSPVIEIDAPKLVVVSGQVAVKPDIRVIVERLEQLRREAKEIDCGTLAFMISYAQEEAHAEIRRLSA